jgi:SAM-dependent methyltransferase
MATEAEKILSRILPHLEGKSVLEIGCGPEKVVPWALSVDHYFQADLKVDVSPESGLLALALGERRFDVVFSSHTIEHLRAPLLETLRYWFRFVKNDGYLIMYLPDESRYVFDRANPAQRNPEHFHYLTPSTFRWYLDQVPGMRPATIEEDPVVHNRYSFLVIAGKS